MSGSIAEAVNSAVSYEKPLKAPWWHASRWSQTKPKRGYPQVDEGSILRAVGDDARQAAACLDENSEVGALPLQRVADEVHALSSKIGAAAQAHFAEIRDELAGPTSVARTAKRVVPLWLVIALQALLVLVESTTMRMALATAYTVQGAILQWTTAIGTALIASAAGYGMAAARIKSLSPEGSDDVDGTIGRSVLRTAWLFILLSLTVLVTGVVWTRVLYTNEHAGGSVKAHDLTNPGTAVGWEHWVAHVLVIAGLMMLAASVSYTLKALDLVSDSATRVRLDAGRQRTRDGLLRTMKARHDVLRRYFILEQSERSTVGVALGTWEEQFLQALPADLRDRWIPSVGDKSSTLRLPAKEADWVGEIREAMAQHELSAQELALPLVQGADERVVVLDKPRLA